MLPAWVQPEVRIQPAWCASAAEVEQEFERSDVLVCLAQQCPQLASAGMLTLGHGQPQALDAAAAAARRGRVEASVRSVARNPAAGQRSDTARDAAAAAPADARGQPAQAWLTTEDLDGLAKDVRDGGAGLTAEQLAVGEAIVWPQQGRILEAWATRLREARETFRDDSALQSLVESAAADYLTALAEPDTWTRGGLAPPLPARLGGGDRHSRPVPRATGSDADLPRIPGLAGVRPRRGHDLHTRPRRDHRDAD